MTETHTTVDLDVHLGAPTVVIPSDDIVMVIDLGMLSVCSNLQDPSKVGSDPTMTIFTCKALYIVSVLFSFLCLSFCTLAIEEMIVMPCTAVLRKNDKFS